MFMTSKISITPLRPSRPDFHDTQIQSKESKARYKIPNRIVAFTNGEMMFYLIIHDTQSWQ
jgi:hypothetical protein